MSSLATGRETIPRLSCDLADRYPLLAPVGDYAEEVALYRRLFEPTFGAASNAA